MKDNFTKGLACILLSAFGFAAMGAFVRLTDDVGTPLGTIQKSFFRNLVALVVAFFLFMRAAHPLQLLRIDRTSFGIILLRSLFGTMGIFGNFYAVSHIPLGDAAMLNKLSPFFAVLVSWICLGERLKPLQGLAIFGAFIGSLCVVKPTFSFGETLPAWAGLGGGLGAGAAYACVHALGIRKVDPRVIILFFSGFSALACLPFLASDCQPMTSLQVGLLVAAGCCAALGQFGITFAYRFCEPRRLGTYDYANVVFAAIFGFFLFGQHPDAFSWIGFGLIVAMALVMRRFR